MKKTYLILATTAASLGYVGGLTQAGINEADARSQRVCEVVSFDLTAQQKTSAETLLAAGFQPAITTAMGADAWAPAAIKATGVTLSWVDVDGVEVTRASANVCADGTWVAGEPQ